MHFNVIDFDSIKEKDSLIACKNYVIFALLVLDYHFLGVALFTIIFGKCGKKVSSQGFFGGSVGLQ